MLFYFNVTRKFEKINRSMIPTHLLKFDDVSGIVILLIPVIVNKHI